nr:uncharacterized mitochondrial protein AtMg00810-like [Tanacetum cinerariifolium]
MGFASYNVVPPSPTGLFAPPTIDLSNSGLEEFQEHEFKGYGVKGTGQKEVRPVWNNAIRVNNQNFSNSRRNSAPTTVLTKSGIVSISSARQSSSRAAVPISTAKPVNTAIPKPFVNVAKPRPNVFQKSYSQSRRPFHQTTTLKSRNLKEKVNTVKAVLNEMEPKKVTQALDDESWVEAIQDELLFQDTICLDIGRFTSWFLLLLAYASFMDFTVYQMDIKSAFLYGTIEEEVYVSQPPGFMDLEFSNRVYKVEKALYGLHQAPRACIKTASTPMETHKPLSKDADGTDVDVHLYRSMIGSLMYLTSFRPNIMFAMCTCLRFQVQPKASHMHAVKRIFRYLKGQPTLGLWYPKNSPLDLISYSDSDYAGASLDRKSTTGGCQFLGCKLISWQCKKQKIMANYTTEAEYIAASNCYGHVLWLQNQLLDYGYNFI